MTAASPEPEALVERRGRAGVIVLNRPKALNALTLNIVRLMAATLDRWERDGSVDRVVIRGAGDRAFCAGGDIRRLYDLGRAGDHDAQLTFWREEYQLDRRIKTYPKPIVALVDGIAMGGGVGLAINAAHRVVGERFVFAMPEVGIGFFPDVGAAWFSAESDAAISANSTAIVAVLGAVAWRSEVVGSFSGSPTPGTDSYCPEAELRRSHCGGENPRSTGTAGHHAG